MRFKASASNVDVDVLNAEGESVLRYQYDNVTVSMDVVGLIGLMPALKDKVDEMQSQLDGR